MARLVVIGDVGGHVDAFAQSLTDAGCDIESGAVPAGVTVIQVGDLAHRGPDSAGCVAIADRFLANRSEGAYVQLLGNHEGHELGGPMMAGYEHEVSDATRATLARWWSTGVARMAIAVDTAAYGPMLVVHGGLTVRRWQAIGSPETPALAAASLNAAVGCRPTEAFRAGLMLVGAGRDAGPAWAEAGYELCGPWLEQGSPPFGQIHGHSSSFRWRDGVWRPGTPKAVRAATTRDRDRRHSWTEIGGRWFVGVDPGHGVEPARTWAPLILEGSLHCGEGPSA